MIQIKRYSNRKYYSLTTSEYIKLGDIRDLVNSGVSIKVTDVPTGKNITKQVTFDAFASVLRGKLNSEVLIGLANGTGLGASLLGV